MTHTDDIYEVLTRDMTARDIARALDLNLSQVSKSLQSLEAYGLIERRGTIKGTQLWRRT